jgi:hypothetical protein
MTTSIETAAIDACVEYVRQRSGVSFVELGRIAESHGVPVQGKAAIELGCPNVFGWFNSTEEFLALSNAVLRHPNVVMAPTSMLTYIGSIGMTPNKPVARQVPSAATPNRTGYRWSSIGRRARGISSTLIEWLLLIHLITNGPQKSFNMSRQFGSRAVFRSLRAS